MAEEKETGFHPETYTHILPEGVPDFDDYTEEDLQQDQNRGHRTVQMQFHFPGSLCLEPSPSQ